MTDFLDLSRIHPVTRQQCHHRCPFVPMKKPGPRRALCPQDFPAPSVVSRLSLRSSRAPMGFAISPGMPQFPSCDSPRSQGAPRGCGHWRELDVGLVPSSPLPLWSPGSADWLPLCTGSIPRPHVVVILLGPLAQGRKQTHTGRTVNSGHLLLPVFLNAQ